MTREALAAIKRARTEVQQALMRLSPYEADDMPATDRVSLRTTLNSLVRAEDHLTRLAARPVKAS